MTKGRRHSAASEGGREVIHPADLDPCRPRHREASAARRVVVEIEVRSRERDAGQLEIGVDRHVELGQAVAGDQEPGLPPPPKVAMRLSTPPIWTPAVPDIEKLPAPEEL